MLRHIIKQCNALLFLFLLNWRTARNNKAMPLPIVVISPTAAHPSSSYYRTPRTKDAAAAA
jgi:hypothetical protein